MTTDANLPPLPVAAVRAGESLRVGMYSTGYFTADQVRQAQRDAIAADRARGWRPIESAPKGDEHILLADASHASLGGWLSDLDCGADYEGQIGAAGWWVVDGSFTPTHWQPLPSLPEQPE